MIVKTESSPLHPCSPSDSEAVCNWAGHVISTGQQTINESTMSHFKVEAVKSLSISFLSLVFRSDVGVNEVGNMS